MLLTLEQRRDRAANHRRWFRPSSPCSCVGRSAPTARGWLAPDCVPVAVLRPRPPLRLSSRRRCGTPACLTTAASGTASSASPRRVFLRPVLPQESASNGGHWEPRGRPRSSRSWSPGSSRAPGEPQARHRPTRAERGRCGRPPALESGEKQVSEQRARHVPSPFLQNKRGRALSVCARWGRRGGTVGAAVRFIVSFSVRATVFCPTL